MRQLTAILLVFTLLMDPCIAAALNCPCPSGSPNNGFVRLTEALSPHPDWVASAEWHSASKVQDTVGHFYSKPLTRRSWLKVSIAAVFGYPAKAEVSQPDSTLTVDQRRIIRQRVDFFANRYWPDMNDEQRQRIANRSTTNLSTLIPWHVRFLSVISLVAGLAANFYLGYKALQSAKRAERPTISRIRFIQVAFHAVIVGGFLWYWYNSYPSFSKGHAMAVDGTIDFDKDTLRVIGIGEAFVQLVDHELVHIFGDSGFRKIKRDVLLAPAYAAVLAVERGGAKALYTGLTQLYGSVMEPHMFYAAASVSSQYPNDPIGVEDAVKGIVEALHGPINPDATSDVTKNNPAEPANFTYSLGLAGVAWITAEGNRDAALLYLDLRGNGVDPDAATKQVKQWLRQAGWVSKPDFIKQTLKDGETIPKGSAQQFHTPAEGNDFATRQTQSAA